MKNDENMVVIGIDIVDDKIVKYHYANIEVDGHGSAKLVRVED
ncbi:hypothetical protein [Salmonella phage SSE121]|uniref:Uncharacterized protein n=2 Tax=Seunavirus TaxID=1914851 RepID=K4I394_9CAUD|nr:hypothetical protein ACQ19_gp006 [Salmonella phage SSE121]AFU63647.1 hypothetical protein [Salmonella phage SSE121]